MDIMEIEYIVKYAVKRIEETHLTASEILAIPSVFNRISEQMCQVDMSCQSRAVHVGILNVILYTIAEVK